MTGAPARMSRLTMSRKPPWAAKNNDPAPVCWKSRVTKNILGLKRTSKRMFRCQCIHTYLSAQSRVSPLFDQFSAAFEMPAGRGHHQRSCSFLKCQKNESKQKRKSHSQGPMLNNKQPCDQTWEFSFFSQKKGATKRHKMMWVSAANRKKIRTVFSFDHNYTTFS